MNSTAMVAACGVEFVAAVRQYRLEVIAEAAGRDLPLVAEAPSDLNRDLVGERQVIDTEIRLIVLDAHCGTGARLRWSPCTGWCLAGPGVLPDHNRFALAYASPLDLAPAAPAVLDWVIEQLHSRPTTAVVHRPRPGTRKQLAMRRSHS